MTLGFGYSPCPNDTFMFWAWAHQKVETSLRIEPRLGDIEELNRQALGQALLPLTKVSASTYLHPKVQANYRLLKVGAALGRGCGPLVVSRESWSEAKPRSPRVAIPGINTTAARLAQAALHDCAPEWVELRYDDIMPAVLEGRVEAGVIIHESRFTYQALGLELAFDLGAWWENKTGLPLPLGVMVARRDLSDELVGEVERALASSLEQAWGLFERPEQPPAEELWAYLRQHAIELDDRTIRAHIELYVNSFSSDLGEQGRAALETFSEL